MKIRYDSYCGLNCGACPVGRANEMDDTEAIAKYAKEWGITEEGLKCTGCKTGVTSSYCTNCEMRICAREKNIDVCVECNEYPCKDITDFRNDKAPHHSAVFSNLEKIKDNGIQKWLEAEEKRWSCEKCGARFTWYSEKCEKCGEKLYNAVDEEKDLKV